LEIVLVPIGSVPRNLLEKLTAPLSDLLGLPCCVGEGIAVPSGAFDDRRGQYRGSAILGALDQLGVPDDARVLGIIDGDCYARGLNFIFGQAQQYGDRALIALPRLRPSFYGLPQNPDLFHQRVLKEATHELGHTYGLGHCPRQDCVMHFSNTLHDTDVKKAAFCVRCQNELAEARRG
jgi:archaemetzincin